MSDIDKFRNDFSIVFGRWIAENEETQESLRVAGMAVRKNIKDADWMYGAASHFAQMAADIRRDRERSERIAAEVREARKAV